MAEAKNDAVDSKAVGDRVAMLSLAKDGAPDQVNPEIIGDKDFAVEAAKRQFAEQAVSAKDDAERSAAAAGGEEVAQDPTVAERQKEHEKAQSAAEKKAEQVVSSLYQG
jgi:hypothetical protein